MGIESRRIAALVATVFIFVTLGIALSGVAAGDILDSGANNTTEGPTLTDWEPQLVNTSTVDTYQVSIGADNATEDVTLIRQRPQTTSSVTQHIIMNDGFGPAMNPEIVSFEGDNGPRERLVKHVNIVNGNVSVTITDSGQGDQQQATLTGITVEFQAESPPAKGNYTFDVEMEGQRTTGGQNQKFDPLNETGVAEVRVVNASTDSANDLNSTSVDTQTSVAQDQTALVVNTTVENPTGNDLAADLFYGLAEGSNPAFGASDLLGQQQNITVLANNETNVSFVVDLTEADEAINTGDPITHGIEVSGNNLTQSLTISDGPVIHSVDDGATVNRTTGLIQTAADISSNADDDVITPNATASPYGENVTIDANNVTLRGEAATPLPTISWAGPQGLNSQNAPVTVATTANNVTITDLRLQPYITGASGIDVLDGSNHEISNVLINGTALGVSGTGIYAEFADSMAISGNRIPNRTIGIALDNVSGSTIDRNSINTTSGDGINLFNSPANVVVNNTVEDIGNVGIYLLSSDNNYIAGNEVSDTISAGIWAEMSNGTQIIDNSVLRAYYGIDMYNGGNHSIVTENNVTDSEREGILSQAAENNTIRDNTVTGAEFGIGIFNSIDDVVHNNTVSRAVQENIYVIFRAENATVTDNVVRDSGLAGVELDDAGNSTFVNNTVINSSVAGFTVWNGNDNTYVDNTVRQSTWAMEIDNSVGTSVSGLDIGASTAPNTTLHFEGENVRVGATARPPADPANRENISRYFEAENLTTNAYLDIAVAYPATDVNSVLNSSLSLNRYNGTNWVGVSESGVDTANNTVVGNITQFSTFGAFGELLVAPTSNISGLDISGQGTAAIIAQGADNNVTVNVSNLGNQNGTFEVNVTVEDSTGTVMFEGNQTVNVSGESTARGTFTGVTPGLPIDMNTYNVTVATANNSVAGTLRVHPDVQGLGNPALDSTGDNRLNDVNGDGNFDILDISLLFAHLNDAVVKNNGAFFEFGGDGTTGTSIFDIQGLFSELQAQP